MKRGDSREEPETVGVLGDNGGERGMPGEREVLGLSFFDLNERRFCNKGKWLKKPLLGARRRRAASAEEGLSMCGGGSIEELDRTSIMCFRGKESNWERETHLIRGRWPRE